MGRKIGEKYNVDLYYIFLMNWRSGENANYSFTLLHIVSFYV